MAVAYSQGAFEKMKAGTRQPDEPLVCKITNVSKVNDLKYTCAMFDGTVTMQAALVSQLARQINSGSLTIPEGAMVRVNDPSTTNFGGETKLIVTNMEILSKPSGSDAGIDTPQAKRQALGPISGEANKPVLSTPTVAAKPHQPTPAAGATPLPTPSPTTEQKSIKVYTPTPGRPSPSVQPLAAINPYDTNWRVRAKLTRKDAPRTFSKGGRDSRLMNVEFIDDQGTAIRGTLWKEACDRYGDDLEENKVYYVSKFSVKMANKKFNTTRNDYEIHLDARTEIQECEDQAAVSASVKLEITPIEDLHRHIGKQAPVDVCGVVTAVEALGRVKRKSDDTEVLRRDVTLADQSGKSVTLTLWGQNATVAGAELEAGVGETVVTVSNCKVSDFNGLALSALSRSVVQLDPTDLPEAVTVRDWWESQGRTATLTPAGQGLANSPGHRAGGGPIQWGALSDLTPASIPSPDEKPTVRQVVVSVAALSAEQTLYYTANPENGRKVVLQDGQWWSEADSKFVPEVQKRYVLNFKVMDFQGDAYVNAFNNEGEKLLGVPADRMAELREGGSSGEYERSMKAAQWTQWVAAISSRSREYQGEVKMRHTVTALTPINFAEQSRRMLAIIKSY